MYAINSAELCAAFLYWGIKKGTQINKGTNTQKQTDNFKESEWKVLLVTIVQYRSRSDVSSFWSFHIFNVFHWHHTVVLSFKPPSANICIRLCLLLCLSIHVVCCCCAFQYSDRTWPLLILGSLMFIPGVYHVRIAYYAFKGYQGFSYEDIPEFEWTIMSPLCIIGLWKL